MSRKVKWELRHDMLASKIWAKLPEQDRVLRQIRRSLIQRQADYALGEGSLLGETELESWRAYRNKLELPDKLSRYFEESETALKKEQEEERRRQRRFIAGLLLVAAILLIATLVSVKFLLKAQESEQRAVEARNEQESLNERLNDNNRQLQQKSNSLNVANTGLREEKLRSDSLARLAKQSAELAENRNKKLAQSYRALAIEKFRSDSLATEARAQAELARAAQYRSDSLRQVAEFLRGLSETEAARANRALGEALGSLLREAEGHINRLNYGLAQKALLSAAELGVQTQRVGAALMELAYFRTEANYYKEGLQLLEEVARLYNAPLKPGQFAAGDSLKLLRNAMKGLDPQQYGSLEARYYPVMARIEGGAFMMGCRQNVDKGCQNNESLHPATVSAFELAVTETTLWQFSLYCEAVGRNIFDFLNARWGVDGSLPAIYVPWEEAVAYGSWVSSQKGWPPAITKSPAGDYRVNVRGKGYRLPTESEWEYAARAGRQGQSFLYSGSNEIQEIAWYAGNASGRPQPVGRKKANELGLYDMSGNTLEWCWDWFGDYPKEDKPDYTGPGSGHRRVLRGGSWLGDANHARVARRNSDLTSVKNYSYGFRLARAL